MKFNRYHLLSGTLLLAWQLALPVFAAPLTLPQAWALAEQNSPLLMAARTQVDAARSALEGARLRQSGC